RRLAPALRHLLHRREGGPRPARAWTARGGLSCPSRRPNDDSMAAAGAWRRLGFRCGDSERHGSRDSVVTGGDRDLPIPDGWQRRCPKVFRCAVCLCSSVLHGESGLQTEGPPHQRVPDELVMRDHNIVSAAKIYAAPSRVHEESSPTLGS
ncbi:unnamed protein product, partial [Urochloa humidicola]